MSVDLHANDQNKYGHSTPEEREGDFFKKIPLELAEKLYKVYEVDFAMFGYDFDFDKYYGSSS